MANYFNQRDAKNNEKLGQIIENDLPPFCEEFFVGISSNTTALTRLNYAYDLRTFFNFVTTRITRFKTKRPCDITLIDLENMSPFEIEKYMNYLDNYADEEGNLIQNRELGKRRKLSALRALVKFFQRKQLLHMDPTVSVINPKIRPKEIIRLEGNEITQMLDVVESGEGLSEHQQKYQENTRIRDMAIVSLLLGTGIRVSELVGIDVNDVDFSNLSFVVTRKGGARTILYFSDEVAGMLYDYYVLRVKNTKCDEKETALFLSLQNKRITTRAVENVVKKYAAIATPLKHITPHKLRSTFGTALYKKTGNIYMVADVLGHKDVNTTQKHYAAIQEDSRKIASTKVELRSDDNDDDN